MFLLSTADLAQRPVSVGRDPLSVHLQSHGSAPMVLHTLRCCHAEQVGEEVGAGMGAGMGDGLSFAQKARTGILGRITFGVWKKLLQVGTITS